MDDEPGSVPPVSVDGSAPDRTGYRALLAGTAVAGLAVSLLLISSPDLEAELRLLGAGALQVAPFVLVAMAAYLAEDSRPLRYVTGVLLLGLIGALVLVSFAFGLLAVLPPGGLDGPDLPPGTEGTALALLGLGSLGGLVSLAGFLHPVRRLLARVIPLDPDSFVHGVALVLVLAMVLVPPVPLIVNGAPPFLSEAFLDDSGSPESPGDFARSEAYSLLFVIYASFLIVGLFIRRTFSEALERLAFVRPTGRQVAFAVGAGLVLVVAFGLVDRAIAAGWGAMGWAVTDDEAYHRLFSDVLSPLGAVTAAVSAGVGEELAVRGVLQPVFGVLLPSLLFAALHAWQYSWDALLSVFLAGLVFAWIRKRSNTTTCAITHGLYDLVLFGAMAAGITI